jgi:lysophospholipase L1-like esterase
MFHAKSILLSMGVSLAVSMSCAALESVGWHYYNGDGAVSLKPSEEAGVKPYTQSNWNNHAGQGQAPGKLPFELKDNNGRPSGIKVTGWTHSDNHSYSHQTRDDLKPDEKLLETYANKNAKVTFSDIPTSYTKGGYTVVVYYTNAADPQDSILKIEGSANDAGERIIKVGTKENSFRAIGFTEEKGELQGPTNYTVFKRLNDPEFTVSFHNDNHNGLCAVQIIAENGPPIQESKTPAAALSPANGATGFKPWQPITWKAGGDGENSYDLYIWAEGAPLPKAPIATVKKPTFTPPAYMPENKTFHWRVITHTESGKKLVSPEFKFTTGTLEGQPPFDVSPKGIAARAESLESLKGIAKLVAKGPGGYPLPDKTTLAFYGDSITDVSEYFKGIENALKKAKADDSSFPDVSILNRGINGGTSDDLLRLPDGDQWTGGNGPNPPKPFKEQVDEDLKALPTGGVYIAVIQIGVNDMLQGDKTPKATYKERITEMVSYVMEKGHKVVLVTPNAVQESPIADIVDDGKFDDAGNKLLNDYAEAMEEIGKEKGIAVVNQRKAYLDYYRNHNVIVSPDGTVSFPQMTGLLNGDGIHPGEKGRELSAELAALGIYKCVTKAGKK